MQNRGELKIGISGWRYAGWRKKFYPADLPQKRELEYAAEHFNSIEINGSFYSLQAPDSYQAWRNATPDGFVFAVKGGQYITHMKRLRDVQAPLGNFFASGVLALAEKLGPILWQFPENLKYDLELFRSFLDMLPRTGREAAALGRRHDHKLKTRAWLKSQGVHKIRHAVEVRNSEFINTDFIELLRQNDVALVVADTAGRWPFTEDVTADFIYVRLHGDTELYASGYTGSALDHWAHRVDSWRHGREPRDARRTAPRLAPATARDVYVYFDNDAKVHAPHDAMALMKRMRLSYPP